jgi:hypothetical protein
MPTTTNGLPYPLGTDPVANGAQDIQDLAEAVDTKSGLWLVKKVIIGSSVSSIPVTDAYPTDFDNFKVIINAETSNGNQSFMYRNVDSGGVDNSSNYARAGYFMTSASLAAVFDNQSEFEVGRTTTDQAMSVSFDVMYPNSARWSSMATQTRGNTLGINFSQYHRSATAFPSFRLFVTGGSTVSGGAIYVYGYRK